MKKKLIAIGIGLVLVVVAYLQPYVRVMVQPDFGVAVTYRLDTGEKFDTLFLWRWE